MVFFLGHIHFLIGPADELFNALRGDISYTAKGYGKLFVVAQYLLHGLDVSGEMFLRIIDTEHDEFIAACTIDFICAEK